MISSSSITPAERAAIISEALPFLRRYRGKTMVIKYGGNAMIDERLKSRRHPRHRPAPLYVGFRPIVVHGGGPEITDAMKTDGKELRVYRRAPRHQPKRSRSSRWSWRERLIRASSRSSTVRRKAVDFSGKDGNLIVARKRLSKELDLGFVGDVTAINPEIIHVLTRNDYIPIISSVAVGEDGETLNINADLVADDLAAALGATKLILLTDVEGVHPDFSDKSSFFSDAHADGKRAI